MESVIQVLRDALAANPRDTSVALHLTELLLQLGREDEAREVLALALSVDPINRDALALAGRLADLAGTQAADGGQASKIQGAGSSADFDTTNLAHVQSPLNNPPEIPATADELLDAWTGSTPREEPAIGSLSVGDVRLSDVAGLHDVKARLERSFFGPMRNPELAMSFGATMRGGLLLYGPPGCGKTFLARAIATELGAQFYTVSLADVLDMWIGSSERNLHQIFEVARGHTPCVIFFDEVDALGLKRKHLTNHAAMRGVVNQFLYELDGVGSQNDGVFTIGATNHPWDVDEALLRPGRLGRLVLVTPPDLEAREEILRTHLKRRPLGDIDFHKIAKSSEGMSGADLAAVCTTAAEDVLERSIADGKSHLIVTNDLKHALRAVKPSIRGWVDTARGVVSFANADGRYDDLVEWIQRA